ncbi:MAG: LysR family transcriptional regulator [Hydrogenophaga sp.]|uniref:LysR family transcriptional regulator n=1 Tax=Hydrogenophaga sp. TaxID=1904254 RepID=UPI0016917B2E|nr:LysR family transcriptional regulator [Hydrogenophaga sp.]NIM40566.1 LysR family transcriptional regulator [Hydrogenophaga sp.]NIN25984.1 LysR family transcriptional regulator [Hydrogenophaga sp.]NIN30856.1 LysR family transcriptional regulator [Hydrogenophaga sp.]NIN54949.1 LysR family transcriptional regulator [Hydrogenophaga sp.]NIO50989.1 LysR family transcriptional regulator [Hydrogenophaga sp.]
MDRLTGMQVFVRVVERGSFSAVARELGSTQGAVSKQVAALERTLGARLLSRTTRSLALTDEGERYFERARRLVAEVEEAEAELRDGTLHLKGWLRVAASVAFGRLCIMPLLPEFLRLHPEVRVDLRLDDGFVDLVEEGVDVAVRIGELPDSSLVARRVGTTVRRVYAAPEYLSRVGAAGSPREPLDLLAHECIVYTGLATRHHWSFTAGQGASQPPGTQQTVGVTGRLQCNNSEVVREAVLAGLGVAHTPCWLFGAEALNHQVIELLPGWYSPDLPIHLVSPAQRRQSAKVRAFGDHVAARLDLPRQGARAFPAYDAG